MEEVFYLREAREIQSPIHPSWSYG